MKGKKSFGKKKKKLLVCPFGFQSSFSLYSFWNMFLEQESLVVDVWAFFEPVFLKVEIRFSIWQRWERKNFLSVLSSQKSPEMKTVLKLYNLKSKCLALTFVEFHS